MGKKFTKFKGFWETYNGFALIAVILGIICLFFPWFRKSYYTNHEFTHYGHIYFFELFHDLKMALFGLLYLLGLIFLILYHSGIILSNHGNYGTPMENHSKLFFKISTVILIIYNILLYFHFINPPPASSGWFSYFYHIVSSSGWIIRSGFILEILMSLFVIVSYIYDKIMLRRHYREHLPDYMPRKSHKEVNSDT